MNALTKLFAILMLLGLAACETAEGFGRDVETAGAAIQGSAQQVQEDLETP